MTAGPIRPTFCPIPPPPLPLRISLSVHFPTFYLSTFYLLNESPFELHFEFFLFLFLNMPTESFAKNCRSTTTGVQILIFKKKLDFHIFFKKKFFGESFMESVKLVTFVTFCFPDNATRILYVQGRWCDTYLPLCLLRVTFPCACALP